MFLCFVQVSYAYLMRGFIPVQLAVASPLSVVACPLRVSTISTILRGSSAAKAYRRTPSPPTNIAPAKITRGMSGDIVKCTMMQTKLTNINNPCVNFRAFGEGTERPTASTNFKTSLLSGRRKIPATSDEHNDNLRRCDVKPN